MKNSVKRCKCGWEMEHIDVKLHEYDKVEWFDVCRRLRPGITQDEYEPIWDKFQTAKAVRGDGRPM